MPNPLNQYVDEIFVITDISSIRNTTLINHLNKHNIKYSFIVAPHYKLMSKEYKTDSFTISSKNKERHLLITLSLCSAFTSAIEIAILKKHNRICVIENDVYFMGGWKDKLNKFFDCVPNDYHILNIGSPYNYNMNIFYEKEKNNIINDYVIRITRFYEGTHCVIFNSSIFSDLKNRFTSYIQTNDFALPPDILLSRDFYSKSKYNCYIMYNPCIYQTSYRTGHLSISNKFKNIISFPSLVQ